MNIYLVKTEKAAEPKKIRDAVREALLDFYRGFELKEVLAAIPESEREFFLEGPGGILWVRIDHDPESPSDVEELISEARYLLRTMNSRVSLYAFFPRAPGERESFPEWKLAGLAETLDLHFFEYEFLWSHRGEALALRERPPADRTLPLPDTPSFFESAPRSGTGTCHFFKRATLAREEITELLEMTRHFQALHFQA